MKRIILAALVLILSVPAFAFSRLFYRFTVRSNYVKAPISTDQLPTPTPTETPSAPTPIDQLSTIPPVEEELVEEIVVEEVEPGAKEDLDGEPGVENTPEEGAVSDIIGSPEGVVLVDPSDPPSTPPAQPSTPPEEEDLADREIAVEEEPGVVNAPEEGREEEVEMSTEEIIEQNVESTPGEAQQ